MRPRRSRRTLAAAAVAGTLVLAACSDGGGGSSTGASTPPPSSTPSLTPPSSAPPSSDPAAAGADASATPAGPPPVEQVVTAAAQPTDAPVPLEHPVQLRGGVVVHVTRAQKTDVVAQGAGEVSGPGVAITLLLRNDGSQPLLLDTLSVTLATGAEAVPAAPSEAEPASPLVGTVEAGDERSGTWVFRTGPGDLSELHVVVSVSADQPAILLDGSAT